MMRNVGKKALIPDSNSESSDERAHPCSLIWTNNVLNEKIENSGRTVYMYNIHFVRVNKKCNIFSTFSLFAYALK